MNTPRISAVDRVWSSYDIAAEILETLAPGPPLQSPSIYPYDHWTWENNTRRNRNALASMARVCRALSGVALDVLWRYIDDIFHLVDVVPSCYTTRCDIHARFSPETIVSSYIAACGSICKAIIIDNTRVSSRHSLGTPTSESCFLFGPTLPGYESLNLKPIGSNMTVLERYYVGYLLMSLSYHNCADWTGVLTKTITECP